MAYRSVYNLTVVTVLAHALLGCCWHHHHAFRLAPAWSTCAELTAVDCESHSCGQEHGGPHQPADGEHRGGAGCKGGRCVFVSGQPSRALDASVSECCDVLAVAATVDDGLSAESSVCARAGNATTRCPLPRTHLLEQVLLL